MKLDTLAGGQRVANPEIGVADESDDVSRVGFVHRLAFLAEQSVRTCEPHLLAGARMKHGHVPFKFAGADSDVRDAVAVLRIHVRLNLENEPGKIPGARFDHFFARSPSLGRRRVLEESLQDQFDTKIVHRAAEKNRRRAAGQNLLIVEFRSGHLEHLQFLRHFREDVFRHAFLHEVVRNVTDLDRCHVRPAGCSLEQVHLLVQPVVNALEIIPVADRPVHGERLQVEDTFDLVQQFNCPFARSVAFVDEGENWHTALAAHLEQFLRLCLDALGRVEHHHHGVHRREHPIRILREILMAWGIE